MIKKEQKIIKNKLREFLEKGRPVMGEYYDILESSHNTEDIRILIERDPDFYDSYLYVANDLRKSGHESEARELEDKAFKRARARIEDKQGNWPDRMPWGWLENRHIIRALGVGADNLWKDDKTDEALDIYRKLFRSNFDDNIGARYAIIALRMGLSYDEYMKQVWPQSSVPAERINKWFKKNAPKFPEELKEWKKHCKDELDLSEKDLS